MASAADGDRRRSPAHRQPCSGSCSRWRCPHRHRDSARMGMHSRWHVPQTWGEGGRERGGEASRGAATTRGGSGGECNLRRQRRFYGLPITDEKLPTPWRRTQAILVLLGPGPAPWDRSMAFRWAGVSVPNGTVAQLVWEALGGIEMKLHKCRPADSPRRPLPSCRSLPYTSIDFACVVAEAVKEPDGQGRWRQPAGAPAAPRG